MKCTGPSRCHEQVGSKLVVPGGWGESGLPVIDDVAELVRLVGERPGLMLRDTKAPGTTLRGMAECVRGYPD